MLKDKKIIVLAITIATIHIVGIRYHLYERGVEIDVPQHFLGGVLMGFIWFKFIGLPFSFRLPVLLFSTLGFVAFISILWEIFEFIVMSSSPSFGHLLKLGSPTTTDILADEALGLLGGLFAFFYTTLRKK